MRYMRSTLFFLVLLAFCQTEGLSGQSPASLGGEFEVNTYTTSDQSAPAVAVDAAGGFVVVWSSSGSSGTDTSLTSIQGQRFASGGTALGGEFQVNTYTANGQLSPAVAVDDDGDFIVVWTSSGSSGTDTSSTSIQGQRFASGGTALGGEFQVNTYTTNSQFIPAVAVDADGDFVVAWTSDLGYCIYAVRGQLYDSEGTAVGGELEINDNCEPTCPFPNVASEPDGDFVVVWTTYDYSPSKNIRGRRYASDGTALGEELQIDTYVTGLQTSPSVAVEADGDFVVVWQSGGTTFGDGPDGSSASVQGQRYTSDGNPSGDEFQVNTYTTSHQTQPSVAFDDGGGFVVVWESNGSSGDTDSMEIQGQRFVSDGTALGGEFHVNTYTTSNQGRPSVAADPDGDFVVVWHSDGSNGLDTDSRSVQGQRFAGLFTDGFESGDPSAWSVSVP